MIEIRTIEVSWYVETGVCDGGGIGRWEATKESIKCGTQSEAEALRDEWLANGKLEKMHWGELRPKFMMGLFRIRRDEKIIEVKETSE